VQLATHLEERCGLNLVNLVAAWFGSLFQCLVDPATVHRLLDVYMGEGTKILYRVVLALFQQVGPAGHARTITMQPGEWRNATLGALDSKVILPPSINSAP